MHALDEPWQQRQRFLRVVGNVLPETLKLRRGPFDDGAHQTIVGGEEENDASVRKVALESVDVDTAQYV